MMELLAPAGSMESVWAAVQNGAHAIYLGYGPFHARRNAKHFTLEDMEQIITYCHVRGTRVFLTFNTLLTDRELSQGAKVIAQLYELGVDAVIVQDLGVARMIRQVAPDLELHGSTQMTVHSLDGIYQCAKLGIRRVVLSRELSRDQLAYLCGHTPIQVEVFVHGALCMSYSGQCYFSSILGGRSGNRGLCAQPCRMRYGWGQEANQNPLSLKDVSLVGYLQELEEMGVSCLKIEGRMKRPEYVAIVTGIYSKVLKERRQPTQEELNQLETAFSRQGFTQGYFLDDKDNGMFGVRQDGPSPDQLYAQARGTYENGENRKEPVRLYAMLKRGEPTQVAVEDGQGRVVRVEGPIPEEAVHVPLTKDRVEGQLIRTGGTPFTCVKTTIRVEEGLSLPLSTLNGLRRQVLKGLEQERMAPPHRSASDFHPGVRYENTKAPPVITISVHRLEQVTPQLLSRRPALLYLPVELAAASPQVLKLCRQYQVEVAAWIPRVCWDRELPQLEAGLRCMQEYGVTQALAGTLDGVGHGMRAGFQVRGDFGLGTYNSQSIKELKRLGLVGATASFELKWAQIRDLSKALPLEALVYGRLPLMLTEHELHPADSKNLQGEGCSLTDRKGEQFPVLPAFGHRSELLNAKTLFLADRSWDYQKLGLWGVRLAMTLEDPQECVAIFDQYRGVGGHRPPEFTRGLYYRDVE